MSLFDDNSDDLTTDAVPSAPRSDSENVNENQQININTSKQKTSRKTRSSQAKNTKQIPNTAFANVINITNSNMVHIGPNVVINPPTKSPSKTSQFVITQEILNLFESKERVTRNDLSFVAQHINEKWKDVGKALQCSDGELNAFEHDYKKDGLREVIFKMLYDWMCRKTKDATIGILSRILWECEQQEAMKLWCEEILKR